MNKTVFSWPSKLFREVKRELKDLSISSKIIIYSLMLLIFSVMLSAFLYQQVLSGTISGKLSDISMQMLYSISANFRSMIDTAGEYSKIVTSNEEIQNTLRNASAENDLHSELKANSALSRLIGGSSLIESVYIFDNFENRYNAFKDPVRSLQVDSIRDAEWFSEVRERRGGMVIRLNGGGVFRPARIHRNYISVIREINSLHTQKTIGIIVINFCAEKLEQIYQGILGQYNTEIAILDMNNAVVTSTTDDFGFDVAALVREAGQRDTFWRILKSNNTEYLVSFFKIPDLEWKIFSVIPIRELAKESQTFRAIAFAVIAINSLLLFGGSVLISRSITVPIKKLLHSMKGIEKGEFKRVDIETGNNEIGRLRNGYNTMIGEIQKLISRIVEEQKTKRKSELDVLQAQIKPHFLYNTFDAISSLALSGKNQDVYNIMKALGTYYRTSLSKGREVITIGEEIDVVVNYLKIQKYRYEDLFSAEYDIDESVKKYRILKLVLQPFVENALYHGIRPKGSRGLISLRVGRRDGRIELEIADDGVGMTKEEIDTLMSGKASRENPGFGVWGTIERLKIFYGIENTVSIDSHPGRGTRVTILVPALGEEGDA